MIQRKPGRPRKKDPNRKLISIDQAVTMINEHFSQYGRKGYSKGYIYNLISEGKLHREGPPSMVLLDEQEIRDKLCG